MTQPDTARKALPSHQSRAVVPMGGWCAVLFGLPFAGGGVVMLLVAAGVIHAEGDDAPPWVLQAIGLVFLVSGLGFVLAGVAGYVRQARGAARAVHHPAEPWLADYPWDRDGIGDDTPRRFLTSLAWTLFLGLFLSPFNYFAWKDAGAMGCFILLIVLFDLIAAAMLVQTLLYAVHELKYGRSRLRFERFPFFLGDALEARLHAGRSLHRYQTLSFTLRCVEESVRSDGDGNKVVCHQVWADSHELPPGEWSEGREPLIRFELPQGDHGTRLSARPPRYWELEVKADTPGLDYSATFLVPVYERR